MLDLDRASASGRGSFAPLLGRRDAVGSVDVHASFFGASDDEDEGAGGAGTPRRYDRLGKQVATAPSVHTSHDAMPTSSDAWAAPRAFSPEDMHAIYARLRRCHGYSPSSGQEDYDDSDDDGYEVDDEDEDNDSTPDASVMITDGQGQRRNSRWYDAESVISTGSVVPTTPSVVGTLSSLGHWGSSEDVSRLGTQLDFDRDVETYSTEEMAKIRHAAEYLHCLDLEEEAFKLRVLVLKRYQAIPPSRSSRASRRAVFGAILACARCASITRHCVIVQTLLNKELENASARARANALVDKRSAAVFGSSFSFALGGTGPAKVSRLEPFLIHMFLAETSFRDFQDAATARQLDLALEQVVGAGGWPEMLAELPDDDRSLDLLLYHQLVRALSPHCDLLEPTALSELRPASDSVRELEDALLTRHPGPFEMDEGSGGVGNPFRAMRNPCLRSCLAWICRELETLSSLTRTWAKMQQVGIANTGSAWLETTVLFTCLWDRWHATAPDTFAVQEKASRASSGANDAGDATPRSRLSAASSVGYYAAAGVDPSATTPLLGDFDLACQDRDSSASVRVGLGMGSGSGTGLEAADDTYTAWMTQSESRMGLSSAELLRTMCGLVSIASHWTFSEREQSLRRRLLTGVLNLANLDDDELARRFLRAFVFRNLVGHISGGGEYYNGPPGGGEGSRDCSEGGAAADVRLHEERMASRVHILGMLEKVLRVALPPEVHAAAAAGSGFAAGAAEAASYAAGQAASYAAGAAGAFMGMVGTLASSAASVAAAAASDPFQGQAGGPLRAAASTILLHMPQITGSGGGSADKANGTNNKPGGYGSPTLASSLKSDDSSLQRMRTTTAVASRRGGLGGGVGEGYGHTASQLLAEARGRPRTAGGNSAISNISMGGNSSGSRVAGRVAQGSAGGIAPPSGAVVQRESLSGSGVSRASTSVSTVSEILERTLTIEDRGSPSTAVATAAAAAAATVACNMAVAAAGGMQRAGHVVRSHVARMASSSGSSNSRDSRSLLDDDVQDAVELRSWAPLYDGIQQGKRGNSIR